MDAPASEGKLYIPKSTDPITITSADAEEIACRFLTTDLGEDVADALAHDIAEGIRVFAGQERREARAVLRVLSEVEPEEVRWLWKGRLAFGKLNEIIGHPGEGKSWLIYAMAARLSQGANLPGDPYDLRREPINVLLVSSEDGAADTIRPRLDAIGADLTRIRILDGFRDEDGETIPMDLRNPSHRTYLRDAIEDTETQAVFIDPITAHLGATDSYKDAEVRGVLSPLARMAEEGRCAFTFVRHLNKASAGRAIHRAGGSIAFTAAVRSSLLVGRPDPEQDLRAIIRVKGNIGPEPEAVGFTIDGGGFAWASADGVTAGDLLKDDEPGDERSSREEAAAWLEDALSGGSVPVKELQRRAEGDGLAWRTIKRAKKSLGIEASRVGGAGSSGSWVWEAPAKGANPPDGFKGANTGPLSESQAREGVSPPPAAKGANSPIYGPLGPLSDSECVVDDDVQPHLEELFDGS